MDTSRGEHAGAQPRAGSRARGRELAPGEVVGDGRYRLLAQFGSDERGDAHFWRARDGQLRRDVALTILLGDPADPEAAGRAHRTLERAAHAGQFEHSAMARILDVLTLGEGISSNEGILGIIVADWARSSDLLDVAGAARERPIPAAKAARMTYALAEAVDRAHQSGLVLGIDHPQRLRVTQDGKLRIAFAGPLPDATLRDDVKALGAVLYLLLTGRWPLDGAPEGTTEAPRSPENRVQPPQKINSSIPSALSSLAVRTIEDGEAGGIRTSSAILRVLGETAEQEEQEQRRRAANLPDEHVEADGTVWTTKKPVKDARRRRKLALGVTVVVIAAVGILGWGGMAVINLVQGGPSGPNINLAAPPGPRTQQSDEKQPPPSSSTTEQTSQAAKPQPVEPAGIRLYNPNSQGDNPQAAAKAIDGNPDTSWQTDKYFEQFPSLKPGLGLLVSFDQPVELSKVKVTTPSTGTVIEIRPVESANPALSSTSPVATEKIDSSHTTIELGDPVRTKHVIVWLSKLSPTGNGDFQSRIGELTFLTKP